MGREKGTGEKEEEEEEGKGGKEGKTKLVGGRNGTIEEGRLERRAAGRVFEMGEREKRNGKWRKGNEVRNFEVRREERKERGLKTKGK